MPQPHRYYRMATRIRADLVTTENHTVRVAVGSTPARIGTLAVEGFLGRTWHVETTMTTAEVDTLVSAALAAGVDTNPTIPVVATTANAIVSGPADLIVSDEPPQHGTIKVTLNGAGPLAIVSNRPS